MAKHGRYRQRATPTDDAVGGDGLSFEEMVEVLYRVLRKHPEAMADVEKAFVEMAKKELANHEPH